MALNPACFRTLEERGLTNADLELLVNFLLLDRNGEARWHINQGRLVTFKLAIYGPLGKPEVAEQVTQLLQQTRCAGPYDDHA